MKSKQCISGGGLRPATLLQPLQTLAILGVQGDTKVLQAITNSRPGGNWETLTMRWPLSKVRTLLQNSDSVPQPLRVCASHGGDFLHGFDPLHGLLRPLPTGEFRRIWRSGKWLPISTKAWTTQPVFSQGNLTGCDGRSHDLY